MGQTTITRLHCSNDRRPGLPDVRKLRKAHLITTRRQTWAGAEIKNHRNPEPEHGHGQRTAMFEGVRTTVIEPSVLTELAERALQEAKDIKNPYLRAVMARFARAALELKVALESEVRG